MTDHELRNLMNSPGPKPGEIWRHYRGGRYSIVARAIDEPTMTPVVVYRSHETGIVWVRPLSVFLENVQVGVMTRPRFAKADLDPTI